MISINVLHYNTFEKTKHCIQSCLKQKGIEYRILLIDNKSTDDSLKKIKNLFGERIEYLENEANFGFAKGNNIGVKHNLKEGILYTLMLNSDTELIGEHLLEELYNVMKKNPDAGIVAPMIYNVTDRGRVLNSNDSGYLKALRLCRIIPPNNKRSDSIQEISEAQGSALFIDNELFSSVGGFPEYFFMYGEESCLAKKILWNQHKLLWFQSNSEYVLHYHDKAKRIDPWRLYLMGRNKVLEFHENQGNESVRWTTIYKISFIITYIRKRKDRAYKFYFQGKRDAEKMINMRMTKEEIYGNGLKKVQEIKSRNIK